MIRSLNWFRWILLVIALAVFAAYLAFQPVLASRPAPVAPTSPGYEYNYGYQAAPAAALVKDIDKASPLL